MGKLPVLFALRFILGLAIWLCSGWFGLFVVLYVWRMILVKG